MCVEQLRQKMGNNRTMIGDIISVVDGVIFLLATMTSRKYSYISPPEYIFIRCAYQIIISGYLKFKGRNFTLYTAANWKPYIAVMITGLLGEDVLNRACVLNNRIMFWNQIVFVYQRYKRKHVLLMSISIRLLSPTFEKAQFVLHSHKGVFWSSF